MKQRCWIYCGVEPYSPLSVMADKRDQLRKHAARKDYEIVSFTSEVIHTTFVECNGALEVLDAITNRKMDVLLMEKGILDHQDVTIQALFEYAQDHGVRIEEIRIRERNKRK